MAGIDYFLGVTNDSSATMKSIAQGATKPTKLALPLAFQADSQDEECAGWIQLQSWSFGVSNSGSFGIGSGGGSGKASMQDFHFTMHPSTATPELFMHCCNGKHFENAFVVAKKSGGVKTVHYLRFWFRKLVISSYQTGGSGGSDANSDSVSFNFASLQLSFTPQSPTGGALPAVDKAWSTTRNIEDTQP